MTCHIFLLALIALELSGCADFARWARQYTYPPEFRYIERDDMRSTMRELAVHSRELNHLMQSSDGPQVARIEIIMHLRAMEQAADELSPAGRPIIR